MNKCVVCKKQQGIEQYRAEWDFHDIVSVRNPEDKTSMYPYPGQLLASAHISINGDVGHICNECLRVALRHIKVKASELLSELDAGHDLEDELFALNERLASLQAKHHNVCYDHNRMQDRLAHVLDILDRKCPRDEDLKFARWEVQRGHVKET